MLGIVLKNIALFFVSILFESVYAQEIDPDQLRLKEIYAARVQTPPVLDGLLDDEVWENVVPESDFLQWRPYNLKPPAEKTEVRLVYDDNYIYVGVNCLTSKPEKIVGRLGRRDSWQESFGEKSDWVVVAFDSNNDDRTGHHFFVNTVGSRLDVALSGGGKGGFDSSWDAVWDFKSALHENGWSIEYRFPFSIFSFEANSNQDWGFFVARHIQYKQEETQWPCVPFGVEGFVPYYGVLKGISDIPSPKKIEALPYLLSGNTDKVNTSSVGIDLKYGFSARSSLNLTFNPDFGQVETDPSVLNLTAFETQFQEKRKFFIEGNNFFKNIYELFYSRRIGKVPGLLTPDDGEIISKPNVTTILGAGKLLGETKKGTKFGIIEAVTDEEYGVWEHEVGDSLVREKILLEPRSNYFIGRVEQPVFNSLSTVGLMVTDLRRNNAGYSNVLGLDWNIRFLNNALSIRGQLVHSSKDRTSGNGARIFVGYLNPEWWELKFFTGYKDKTFEINDLGFDWLYSNWYYGVDGGIRKQKPWGRFLKNDLKIKYHVGGRGDGLINNKYLRINQKNDFKNYWSIGSDLDMNFAAFNDYDTFRDNDAWVYKSETIGDFRIWIRTDQRKQFTADVSLSIGRGQYSPWENRFGLKLNYKPLNNVSIALDLTQDYDRKAMEWVGIEEDSLGKNIIYAESSSIMRDIKLRFNWTFSPELTFEAFMQPFTVNMDYLSYNKLLKEKTRDLEPYIYTDDPDFKLDNNVGTFVLRWEYKPGSTAFIVYNFNKRRSFSSQDQTWSTISSNSLFLKLNYWFQI
tara:strand:- start:1664 stop:4057 length:2394 start_codon:yes stop_codon:yes gene_type:complete